MGPKTFAQALDAFNAAFKDVKKSGGLTEDVFSSLYDNLAKHYPAEVFLILSEAQTDAKLKALQSFLGDYWDLVDAYSYSPEETSIRLIDGTEVRIPSSSVESITDKYFAPTDDSYYWVVCSYIVYCDEIETICLYETIKKYLRGEIKNLVS